MSTGKTFNYKKYINYMAVNLVSLSILSMMALNSFADADSTAKKMVEPTIKQPVVGGESVMNVVLSLLLVVGAIFLLAWMMRRLGGATLRSNAFLKVVSSVSMGARERVVLVQVGEQQLILGVAPGRVQTLHVLDKPITAIDSEYTASSHFSERFKSILNKEK